MGSLWNSFLYYCWLYSKYFFFQISSSLIKKIHPFSFAIINFYICAGFWKHYAQSLNCIIIIHLTNKVFKIFLTRTNLVTYYYVINVHIFLKNLIFIAPKFPFFNFIITKRYNFFTHPLYLIMNFNVLQCSIMIYNVQLFFTTISTS